MYPRTKKNKAIIKNSYNNTKVLEIDNDGDYTSENCRWTTKSQQQRNTRQTKLSETIVKEIRYGKYKNLSTAEITRIIGCNWTTVDSVRKGKTWRGI